MGEEAPPERGVRGPAQDRAPPCDVEEPGAAQPDDEGHGRGDPGRHLLPERDLRQARAPADGRVEAPEGLPGREGQGPDEHEAGHAVGPHGPVRLHVERGSAAGGGVNFRRTRLVTRGTGKKKKKKKKKYSALIHSPMYSALI